MSAGSRPRASAPKPFAGPSSAWGSVDADFNRGTFGGIGGTPMVIQPGPGNDAITGEAGNVGLVYDDAPRPIDIDLATGRLTDDGYGTTDTFSGINWVMGTNFEDTMRGADSGFENFIGRSGNDYVDGRGGWDQADYYGAGPASGAVVDLSRGLAEDDGFGGTDTLINIENVLGTDHADRITGNDGPNFLNSTGGADVVFGLDGPDHIVGDVGDDTLNGGKGDDRLEGGDGSDKLTGGKDNDTFAFSGANDVAEIDTIVDFEQDLSAVMGLDKGKVKADYVDVPDNAIGGISDELSSGGWRLVLPWEGDIINLPGVKDFDKDGSILDDIFVI